MFDSLTWLHLTWLKLQIEESSPPSERGTLLWWHQCSHLDRQGGWVGSDGALLRQPATRMEPFFGHLALPCATLRTHQRAGGGGSAAHIANSPHLRQSTEDSALLLEVKRTVDKPRFGQHQLCGLGRRYCTRVPHSVSRIFSAREWLSLALFTFLGPLQKVWLSSFLAFLCGSFLLSILELSSAAHQPVSYHLKEGHIWHKALDFFFIPIWNLHNRLLQPLKTVPSRLNTNQNRSTHLFFFSIFFFLIHLQKQSD